MKSIYRKLKDYIYEEDCYITSIFGTLMNTKCVFNFENPKKRGKYIDWQAQGVYGGQKDFLLDYYVVGIYPDYKIENDTIKPYLRVILKKEVADYE